jgi:hypothetical protein
VPAARPFVRHDSDDHSFHAERPGPAAGFPVTAGNVPFVMKDVVLLAASIYLLKQDVVMVALGSPKMGTERAAEF